MRVTRGSRDLNLEFWDPLRISGTVEARNSKFGMKMDPRGTNEKKMKNLVKGVTRGSGDPILEFWDPLRISGTVEARNSKFGMQMDPEGN